MADQVLQSPTNPHFFQPLLPGFHSQLNIPVKFFLKQIEGKYERNTVELRSDACEKTWKVKMEGQRLTVGWKEFAVAYDFRVGDIIIFRHQGDLVFHVTGLGPSCCEIQYDHDNINNLSREQNLKTEPDFSSEDSCFEARITDSNLRDDRLYFRKCVKLDGLKKGSNKIVLMDEDSRKWTLNMRFNKSSGAFYMRVGWRSFCHENGLKPGDSIKFKLESINMKTPLLRFSTVELKRVSTKHSNKGKSKLGESSQRASSSSSSSSLSENRFVTLTAKPNYFNNSSIYLCGKFTEVNQLEKVRGKKINLLDKNGVKWPVNLLRNKGYCRLGSELNEFLKAIDVKVNESFVLELVRDHSTSPPMLKFCSKVEP